MVETSTAIYSRTLSHKCATREFLSAPFPTWTGSLRRPGDFKLPETTISALRKADVRRTFDRHRIAEDRTLNHKPSNSLDLHRSWITRPRHKSRSNIDIKSSYIKAVAGGVSSVILR
ncbi:hypothetical protein CEXT_650051 [Caerostris extrusa]|uniref:Uncharacterized protein n=1 Tax=Caerostris extrusa TaxID=172846 RepID=A0AAV4MZK2_CAEEX|nr:hypothetical protein CEXT_650051 [Caerostris extrusa]